MAKNKIYKGIDISLFQPGADFPAVKAAGIDFVMLKAGQGRIPGEWNAPFTDPYFERYIRAADAAGLTARRKCARRRRTTLRCSESTSSIISCGRRSMSRILTSRETVRR